MFVVSAVVVYFRDLRQAIPLILQLGLFALGSLLAGLGRALKMQAARNAAGE